MFHKAREAVVNYIRKSLEIAILMPSEINEDIINYRKTLESTWANYLKSGVRDSSKVPDDYDKFEKSVSLAQEELPKLKSKLETTFQGLLDDNEQKN